MFLISPAATIRKLMPLIICFPFIILTAGRCGSVNEKNRPWFILLTKFNFSIKPAVQYISTPQNWPVMYFIVRPFSLWQFAAVDSRHCLLRYCYKVQKSFFFSTLLLFVLSKNYLLLDHHLFCFYL